MSATQIPSEEIKPEAILVGDVFVVDDEPIMQEIVAEVTRIQFPFLNVRAFNGGSSAAEALGKSMPKLLITDIVMCGLDGIGLIHKARAIASVLPILVISGFANQVILEAHGLALGESLRFLAKPFTPDELFQVLDQFRAGSMESAFSKCRRSAPVSASRYKGGKPES